MKIFEIENVHVNLALICFADHAPLTEPFLIACDDILAADDEPFWLKR